MSTLPKQDLDHVLAHVEPLLRGFSGGRIYITGGTGFIGKWLLESLLYANRKLSTGIHATVLSRDPEAFLAAYPHFRDPALDFRHGDVCDPQDCNGHDAVIHASGDSDDKKNSAAPLTMLDSIVQGGRNILEAAANARCSNMLILGSGAVYGDQPADMSCVAESCRLAPQLDTPNAKAMYGEGKRIVELLAAHFSEHHALPVCTARCFSFLGPYLPLDRHFAAGNFFRDLLSSGIIKVNNGTPIRSYLYPADLTIWLWTLLFLGAPGSAINVGSDQPVTIQELAQSIAALRPGETSILAPNAYQGPDHRYVPDINKARADFGLDVLIDLPTAIRRTYDWHCGNRDNS